MIGIGEDSLHSASSEEMYNYNIKLASHAVGACAYVEESGETDAWLVPESSLLRGPVEGTPESGSSTHDPDVDKHQVLFHALSM